MNVFAWLNAGGHVNGWSSTRQDASQVEMTQENAEQSKASDPIAISTQARKQRNGLLSASDWTMLTDAPLTLQQREAWAAYRQDLRDVPDQQLFPTVIDWPVAPA